MTNKKDRNQNQKRAKKVHKIIQYLSVNQHQWRQRQIANEVTIGHKKTRAHLYRLDYKDPRQKSRKQKCTIVSELNLKNNCEGISLNSKRQNRIDNNPEKAIKSIAVSRLEIRHGKNINDAQLIRHTFPIRKYSYRSCNKTILNLLDAYKSFCSLDPRQNRRQ
jgi:hypothetical protein